MADAKKDQTNEANNEAPKAAVGQPDENSLKAISAVGYLGILFLVPMLMFPKDKFAIFHANQGLLLFITAVAINIVGGIIPVLGWFVVIPLGNIFILVLFIMGIVNAFNGQTKRLPLIGSFDILKVQE